MQIRLLRVDWPRPGAPVLACFCDHEHLGAILDVRDDGEAVWLACHFGDRRLYFMTVKREEEATVWLFNGRRGRSCTYARRVSDLWGSAPRRSPRKGGRDRRSLTPCQVCRLPDGPDNGAHDAACTRRADARRS